MAGSGDEVVVRLESGGGVVHGYGLAASQLQRIREQKIPLTVAVDKVAASGGYLMACVADQIIAAPFAIIGSIGVLAQLPNLHRLLKKHEIDFEQIYAGEYKRTLTLFGENTDKAREKMREELEETHGLFKDYVKVQRPDLDIEKVATGEHWLATRALELGLVDRLQTSDDYLMAARRDAQLILLSYTERKKLLDRLASLMSLGGLHRSSATDGLDRAVVFVVGMVMAAKKHMRHSRRSCLSYPPKAGMMSNRATRKKSPGAIFRERSEPEGRVSGMIRANPG